MNKTEFLNELYEELMRVRLDEEYLPESSRVLLEYARDNLTDTPITFVEMHPVVSSNVVSVGWNDKTDMLYVKFKQGPIYGYVGVSKEEFEDVLKAESVGKAIHAIKSTHGFTRID